MTANDAIAVVQPLRDGGRVSARPVPIKTYILVALGCAFWLLPIAWLSMLTWIHGKPENGYGFHCPGSGFSYDLLLLFGIPLVMLALTLLLGWLARQSRLTAAMTDTSTVLAVLASVSWCATLLLIQTA